MKKRTLLSLLSVAAVGAGAAGSVAALGNLLYSKFIAAAPSPQEGPSRWPSQQTGRQWMQAGEGFREITIQSTDGLKLWAALVPAEGESHRWVICLHDCRADHTSMGSLGRRYARAGWNVLLPDHRGHGNSQGNYIGWGYDERLDLIGWINYIVRRDPEAEIVLHGVSMGAAAVLMATGGPMQEQVKAAIADGCYTSLEQFFKHTLDHRRRKALSIPLPIPFSALFSSLRNVTLRRAGYDLRDAAPIEAATRSKIPTLFIHGGRDETVPPAMTGKLYEAARCPRRFLWVQDAGHGECADANPELYWKTVSEFLRRYMH